MRAWQTDRACLDQLSHGLRREDALFDLGFGRFGVLPLAARGFDEATARRLTARLEAHAAKCLAGIRGAEDLQITAGFCLETQPGARSGRTIVADSLAAGVRAPRRLNGDTGDAGTGP